ncbi:MAG: hypothetical protein PHQ44_04510 [Anaerovibrio sp.]|nr:hypothetical protein [Anaerovibrio sp.]
MNIEQLKAAGIDYEDGLHRFADNQRIYEKYLRKLTEVTLLDEARTALQNHDHETAFDCFHKLKAFVGNLSIPPLYEKVRNLTETLRQGNGSDDDILAQIAAIEGLFQKIIKVIQEEG